MHAIDFTREPESTEPKAVYAVFGDDAYLRREAMRQIRRIVVPDEDDEVSVARFAGDDVKLADVLDEVRTLPFFSSRRLVIVEGADGFVTAHRKELEAYVEHPSASGVLVLAPKTWPSNTRLARLVDSVGLAIDCKGPNARTLAPWLVFLAQSRHRAVLEPAAAELLIDLIGPEVGLLVSEVEKLAVSVGDRARIQREDVARVVGAGRIETVWKVIDAVTTGRGAFALEHLDRLLAAGEHPVGLLAMMTSSLLKVHHAGRLRRNRVELREACAAAGIPPFAVETTRNQHAHLGPTRVDRLPSMLLQADLDLKGASMLPARVVLEKLFVALASPRRDERPHARS